MSDSGKTGVDAARRESAPGYLPPVLLGGARVALCVCFSALLLAAAGCSRFRQERHDFVYVSAPHVFLHDRVAAVSNRIAEVTNGERLLVLEHGKRFLKIQTPKNEVGWIEARAVIDGDLYGQFEQLSRKHRSDPLVATAVLRDELYMHLLPGRETQRFYLIAANTKVQLLERDSVPKAGQPGFSPLGAPSQPARKPEAETKAQAKSQAKSQAKPTMPVSSGDRETEPSRPDLPSATPVAPTPVAMEDWWLARDPQGHTGWLIASHLDVDLPEEISTYAEGQRMVAAYTLTKITDPDSNTPDQPIPEYVTVLSEPRNGLPYDFDQVRVFTWSLKHHRYETAFRLRNIVGYLPVTVAEQEMGGQQHPVFSIQIANGPDVKIDPESGMSRPEHLRTILFRLDDNLVHRTGMDMGPIPSTKPENEQENHAKGAKKGKAKRD